MASYIPQMNEIIARVLEAEESSQVNVKAYTNFRAHIISSK
jgi:2-C-methyl-D-erythritol 2,4-cyclodiphosphate synthase